MGVRQQHKQGADSKRVLYVSLYCKDNAMVRSHAFVLERYYYPCLTKHEAETYKEAG